jgi:CheY-like chemotaxis protein
METTDATDHSMNNKTRKKMSVLLWRESRDQGSLDLLTSCCQQQNLEVKEHDQLPDNLAVGPLLKSEPAILMIPAIKRDCLGVKLAQEAMSLSVPTAVALYGRQLPTKEYLCLAFRAGIDEVISLKSSMDLLNVQIRRLCRNLGQRINTFGKTGELRREITSLTSQCEKLQRENSRKQERLLALAQTAGRLAAAELEPAKIHPRLLIVASSKYQAAKAEGRARRLGFNVYTVPNAQAALEDLANDPPRIVLCDSVLPDMDVGVFAKAARHRLGATPVFIIAWSSNAHTEDKLLSPELGIDDFVLKSARNDDSPLLTAALLGGLR